MNRRKNTSDIAAVRCAIYTRKSTDEGLDQEFNTLDAQRESGEAYVASRRHEGWECVADQYDDGGFTGGNMERPALQHLMTDIEAGRVDCVVVYKVDRLSRSLLDFARMMEVFEQDNVSFVSVTQQFNTATSMGRLVLNLLLSFAQFEREMISERTRDKIAAARRKGKSSGGLPLLGYDVVDTKLVVNSDEAEMVRTIFELYLEHDGLLPVVEELERRGWRNKRWTTQKGIERRRGARVGYVAGRALRNPRSHPDAVRERGPARLSRVVFRQIGRRSCRSSISADRRFPPVNLAAMPRMRRTSCSVRALSKHPRWLRPEPTVLIGFMNRDFGPGAFTLEAYCGRQRPVVWLYSPADVSGHSRGFVAEMASRICEVDTFGPPNGSVAKVVPLPNSGLPRERCETPLVP